jgi:hypothetical protein
MQALYCHSHLLRNVLAGIIVWLVINRGFSSIHQDVGCGSSWEIMWS